MSVRVSQAPLPQACMRVGTRRTIAPDTLRQRLRRGPVSAADLECHRQPTMIFCVKQVRFTIALDADVRLRHRHRTDRGGVVSFVIQLEVRLKGRWRPVIRYDSAHG